MLDRFVDSAVARLRAGEMLAPAALGVLLRVYATTGREDIAGPLERALGEATAIACNDLALADQVEWLTLFADAARYAEDDRLPRAASAVAASLDRATAREHDDIAGSAMRLAALLTAAPLLDASPIVGAAIDDLERLVSARYAPGAGLRGCSPADAVAVASALLEAFNVTGRLAYPMLAEELMIAVRPDLAGAPPLAVCAAARVLSRLARLHDDDGYRATAVVAPEVDLAADAAALLERIGPSCATPREEAAYALALAERVSRS